MITLRKTLLTLCFVSVAACSTAGKVPPLVVLDASGYRASVKTDSRNTLVDLRARLAVAHFDIRYATADNFMHRVLYSGAEAFLRQPAAEALARVEANLRPQGMGLIVFDGYRPYQITREMWDAIHDDRFVADPAKGSRHNRGCAVDVSLYDLASGKAVEMPTAYDDFTARASLTASDVTATAASNRALLRTAMERQGFQPLPSEWWHYDFGEWRRFALLDVPFSILDQEQPVSRKEH